MNRRNAISTILLTPAFVTGFITSSLADEVASAPANKLTKTDLGMTINSASVSVWSASMSGSNLLPTFTDSPQSRPASQTKPVSG
jgi:hypothetical protein